MEFGNLGRSFWLLLAAGCLGLVLRPAASGAGAWLGLGRAPSCRVLRARGVLPRPARCRLPGVLRALGRPKPASTDLMFRARAGNKIKTLTGIGLPRRLGGKWKYMKKLKRSRSGDDFAPARRPDGRKILFGRGRPQWCGGVLPRPGRMTRPLRGLVMGSVVSLPRPSVTSPSGSWSLHG